MHRFLGSISDLIDRHNTDAVLLAEAVVFFRKWLVGYDGVKLFLFERFDGKQAIDEEAVTPRCRYAPCGSVRTGNQPDIFEVGLDITHRRRRKVQA